MFVTLSINVFGGDDVPSPPPPRLSVMSISSGESDLLVSLDNSSVVDSLSSPSEIIVSLSISDGGVIVNARN